MKIVQEHTNGTGSAALSITSNFSACIHQFLVIYNRHALRNTHKRSVYNVMFNEPSQESFLKAYVAQKQLLCAFSKGAKHSSFYRGQGLLMN